VKFSSFQIVVEKEPEHEDYYAYCPELPGCFSNGSTEEETRQNMHEAIWQHVESLHARNSE